MMSEQGWEDCHKDTRIGEISLLKDMAVVAGQVMVTDTSCPEEGPCIGPQKQRDFLPFLPDFAAFHLSAMLTSLEMIWDPEAGAF